MLAVTLLGMAGCFFLESEEGWDDDDDFPPDTVVRTAADVEALRTTIWIQGALIVEGSDVVELDLPALQRVDWGVVIEGNPALRRIAAPKLAKADGVSIVGNPALEELEMFGLGAEVRSFTLADNDRLDSVSGLAGLGNLELELIIADNPALTSLSGLGTVGSAGRLEVTNNDALTDLEGLHNLDFVGDAVEIQDNERLASLAGLGVQDIGSIVIADNPALATIDGLALTRVISRFEVTASPALTEISLPPALVSLAALSVHDLPALRALRVPAVSELNMLQISGAAQLTEIDLPALTSTRSLTVTGNAALEQIGLPLLTAANAVVIEQNPLLAQCQIDALVARLVPAAGLVKVSGNGDGECSQLPAE